ncbi:MAG: LysE family translocator [Bacteroidales bacterium]|nr:LysE family translocator [Bacteroidales bacterium]
MNPYISLFIEGFIIGLVVAMSLGPAFFTIIQTSIDKGFRYAIIFAAGIALSDLFVLLLSFLGLSSFIEKGKNEFIVLIIGSTILIIYGIYTFFKKPDILLRRKRNLLKQDLKSKPSVVTLFIKGFFLNLFNPVVILFWISVSGYLTQRAIENHLYESALFFFGGIFTTIVSTDILKSFVGYKIKRFLRPRVVLILNKIVGIILFIFAIILIIENVYHI